MLIIVLAKPSPLLSLLSNLFIPWLMTTQLSS